ncbi:NT-3 growth factor receptor [Liparis tanakae]|uniref:NT-3 growth factor receptor n=1 Tax=Liparis tanakae TaxID=230148 RepID=A0A4Z2EEP0_9TELE|nr:NT-3 growth factor receptor [Liparis tanakae]
MLELENAVTNIPPVLYRNLDGVVFDCGCDIRWIQLWQQRGEAGLHTQQLYCRNGASKIRLHNMYIHDCDERRIGGDGREGDKGEG